MSRPILVVKLGALGDVVLALGPMAAIRKHHLGAEIVALTTPAYADLLRRSPYVDRVEIDRRPPPWRIDAWLDLRRRLRRPGFARVYDLQTSDRSGWYFRLLGPGKRPEWSGVARGCSHPHANPRRDLMHTLDRQAEQLRAAGIDETPPPDLSWLAGDVSAFDLPRRYALLAPGGSAGRPAKRWPIERFAELARRLAARGVVPVAIGTDLERSLAAAILGAEPAAANLVGRTDLAQLAELARRAEAAIGNDTGPMHLIAAAGAPSVVLFSGESDPALCAPRGAKVRILRRDPLAALPVEEAERALALT